MNWKTAAACFAICGCRGASDEDQAQQEKHQTAEIEQLKLRVDILENATTAPVSGSATAEQQRTTARYQLIGLGGDNPPTYTTMAGCLAAKHAIEEDRSNAKVVAIYSELSCIAVGN